MSRQFFYLTGFYLLLTATMVCNCNGMGAEMNKRPTTLNDGSRCVYSSFEGSADIITIKQTPASQAQAKVLGGPRYEGYEVWFRFRPKMDYSVDRLRSTINREHLLTLNNGWYVGPRYLEKYGIKEGNSLLGTLKLIEQGTCKPVVFEFDTVDLNDYFETRN